MTERRAIMVEQVQNDAEQRRCASMAQQPVQVTWTSWEGICEHSLTWSEIQGMSECELKFLLRVTYDMLSTSLNLKCWQLTDEAECCECGTAPGCLESWLSGCKQLLPHGTYHHSQVLKQLAGTIRGIINMSQSATAPQRQGICFIPVSTSVTVRKAAK